MSLFNFPQQLNTSVLGLPFALSLIPTAIMTNPPIFRSFVDRKGMRERERVLLTRVHRLLIAFPGNSICGEMGRQMAH